MASDIANPGRETEAEALPPRHPRPKTVFFAVLAAVWLVPSAGGLVILGSRWRDWFEAASLAAAARQVLFEQWVAVGVLALQGVLAGLALYFHFTELPRQTAAEGGDPGLNSLS